MTAQQSFLTEVSTMQVAANHVNEVAEAIQTELRNLDSRIQPVIGTWQGAGAQAYLGLHQRWVENATKLRGVLAEISQGLTQNAVRYQESEDTVTAQMTRVAGQL